MICEVWLPGGVHLNRRVWSPIPVSSMPLTLSGFSSGITALDDGLHSESPTALCAWTAKVYFVPFSRLSIGQCVDAQRFVPPFQRTL